jgi:NADH-quinone oxidoreductase subunit L
LVGVSSYLLIGFWYERPAAAEAGKKAFLVNKIGDFGFILGILLVWSIWGTVDFEALMEKINVVNIGVGALTRSQDVLTIIALLLFCGAVGKSAQIPLHVWLPDAMEGPTPVSALIHAATMVAAGVYMLCRVFFLISLSEHALEVISVIGGLTALLAALWAVVQNDIKRILAYSTLSQLGYMVMAIGLASPNAAMFHLTTHAAFKALLFLGAGSIIVALHHEQNIWKMGGLAARMLLTTATFGIGLLALCGVPFFSGSLSKDQILMLAFQQNKVLFGIGIFTAFLTAFYMGRLFLIVFFGLPRDVSASHARENSPVMVIPLVILAVLSLSWIGDTTFLESRLFKIGGQVPEHASHLLHGIFIAVPLLGLATAWVCYGFTSKQDILQTRAYPVWKALHSKFYFDEIYDFMVTRLQGGFAGLLRFFDAWIIDGLFVKGISLTVLCVGNALRIFQTGNLQTYTIFFGLALAGVIYWILLH